MEAALIAQENLSLKKEMTSLQQRFEEQIKALQTELRFSKLQVEQLKRRLFGPIAEKLPLDAKQQELLLETVAPEQPHATVEVIDTEETVEIKKRRPVRHPIPAHVETVTVRLEPEEKVCAHCGQDKCEIGCEVTTELDFIPAKFIKREIIRPKLACDCGEGKVSIASLPPRLIEKGRPGAGLLAQVVLNKYVDHLPLYRQEQIFQRLGVNLSRQTLCDWTEQAAFWLQSIYKEMKDTLLADDYLQVDETPVRVLDPEVTGKAAQGYLWVYARPRGDVIFEFDPSRGLEAPKRFLENFKGTIQTDGYQVYESLTQKNKSITRIGCWAHARRKFYDALIDDHQESFWFLDRIRKLYAIERRARDECLDPPHRQTLRKEKAPEILHEIRQRLESLRQAQADRTLLPQSLLGKAVNYTLGEWVSLNAFVENGVFEIDNNLCENSIRPTALGKKNWLFFGHPQAAWKSALIYSVLVSCKRHQIDPAKYLTDIFTRLPASTNHQIKDLVPSRWKPN
jgi:transposase